MEGPRGLIGKRTAEAMRHTDSGPSSERYIARVKAKVRKSERRKKKANSADAGSVSASSSSNGKRPSRELVEFARNIERAEQIVALKQTSAGKRKLGSGDAAIAVLEGAVAATLAQEQSKRSRQLSPQEEEQFVDNGAIPYDTMGNLPLTKLNRALGLTTWNREIKNFQVDSIATTNQVDTVYLTATAPCKITGFRWVLRGVAAAGASGWIKLALQIARQGVTSYGALSITSGATDDFCGNASDVILYDTIAHFAATTGDVSERSKNSTYKFSIGDRLIFSYRSTDTAVGLAGALEWWMDY